MQLYNLVDVCSWLCILLWLDHPEVFPPQKERSSKTSAGALHPFEVQFYTIISGLWFIICFSFYSLIDWNFLFKQCRQAKVSYTGSLHIDVCFQWDGGVVIREKVNFGEFPIMLRVSFLCSSFPTFTEFYVLQRLFDACVHLGSYMARFN